MSDNFLREGAARIEESLWVFYDKIDDPQVKGGLLEMIWDSEEFLVRLCTTGKTKFSRRKFLEAVEKLKA